MIPGRILWTSGNLFSGKPKFDDNKQPVIDQKSGQQVIEYGFGLAVLKVDPQTNQWSAAYIAAYQAIHGEAMTLYPTGQLPPGFALKYKDGDNDVDQKGVKYSEREGYANHIVIACTTQIPIKYYQWDGQNNVQVNSGFKCGDYVEVQVNFKAHPATTKNGKPGLYTNPSAVRFIAAGQEIINTPSGDQMFGTAAPTFAGNIIAPTMGAMPNVGGMPQQNNGQQNQNQNPPMPNNASQQQYNQNQQQNNQPHYDVIPPNLQPNQNNGQTQMPQQNNNQQQPPVQNNNGHHANYQQNNNPGNGGYIAPAVNGPTGSMPTNTVGNPGQGQQYANTASPSNNGMPQMPPR